DQTVDGDELGQFFFRHSLRTRRALWQDKVTNIGSAIVHLNFFTGRNLQPEHIPHAGTGILHDLCPVALVLVPPGCIAKNVVGIAGAQRTNDDAVNLVGILHHHQLADFPLVHAHLSKRLATGRQQRLLKRRIRPRFGDDHTAGPWALLVKLLPTLLQLLARRPTTLDQRLDKYLKQSLVILQILLQIHHAFFQGAVVFLLLDFEKVVVIAALLAVVLGYHVHSSDGAGGPQRDAFHIFFEPFFQVTHAGFDVFSLRLSWFEELIVA